MALNKGDTAYYTRLGDEYGAKLMNYLVEQGLVKESEWLNWWDSKFENLTETHGTDDSGEIVPLPEYPSVPRPRNTPRPHFTE